MKKNLLYLFALICSMNLFTACNSDDDVKYPIDVEVAGTYKGTLDVTLNGNNIGAGIPKNVSITDAGNNSINMELKDFVFMGIDLKTILISNCAVTQSGTTYAFTGTQTLTSLPEAIGQCPVVVNGTIVDGKATINLDITVPTLKQTVKVVYKGTRLSGSESSEAKMSSFTIDSEVVTEQPVINEAAGTITFKVNADATDEALKLTPTFTVSEKATVFPATGVVQDFSEGKAVVYTVIAEDGTVKAYTASIAGSQSVQKFSFEDWVLEPDYGFYTPTGLFGSTNEGSGLVYSMLDGIIASGIEITKPEYPVRPGTDAKLGAKAALLQTIDLTGAKNGFREFAEKNPNEAGFINYILGMCPNITAGSLFLGKFQLSMADPLLSTQFGIPYANESKPVKFTGWYKYTPGAVYYSKDHEVLSLTDKCAIFAVLYEEKLDSKGKNIPLTGAAGTDNINNSSRIVLRAALPDGSAKAEWTNFELPFESVDGRSYSKDKKYYLTYVCSSSFDGDRYNGAPGSTLIVDGLSIVSE